MPSPPFAGPKAHRASPPPPAPRSTERNKQKLGGGRGDIGAWREDPEGQEEGRRWAGKRDFLGPPQGTQCGLEASRTEENWFAPPSELPMWLIPQREHFDPPGVTLWSSNNKTLQKLRIVSEGVHIPAFQKSRAWLRGSMKPKVVGKSHYTKYSPRFTESYI